MYIIKKQAIFKLIFIFIVYFTFINFSFASPDILETSIKNNSIFPNGKLSLDVTYQDKNGGINILSDELKLYKYNGTNWGSDISSSFIDFSNKNISQNHAIYTISKLGNGKYKFNFSINNKNSETSSIETIFFVDEPNLAVNSDIINIGELELSVQKESETPQKLTVKTIGTPYKINIKNPKGLDNFNYKIETYDGIKGWGINKEPFNTGEKITAIENPEILGQKNLRISTDGIQFEDNYLFKIGAKYVDNLQAAGIYTGTLDFNINLTYCNEYNDDEKTCKDDPIKIKETSGVKKWSDGTYSKTCFDYQNTNNSNYSYLGDIGDGYYMIRPDSSKPAFKAYCDMTTNGGGWTQYVNVKGNYSFENAKSCWLGNNIVNSNLECFNPNRYAINVEALYNDDWSGNKYFYDIKNIGAKLDYQNPYGRRRCLGHKEFMTIMGYDNYPSSDASNSLYVRFGRSYCGFGREVAGRSSSSFMNYDTGTADFGVSTGAARQGSAKNSKLYFREKSVANSGNNIVIYNSGKRWSDGTYAKDCNEYKNPPSGYSYKGSIGNGNYYIDNDGSGANGAYLVYCDMTTDSGGWTKLEEWNNSGTNNFIAGDFSGGSEILMTYKRKDSTTNNYAIKIKQFKTKQCGNEHTTIADYVSHLLTGSWGDCKRETTSGDYNDIITEKIIEGDYIDDTCVNGNLHKDTARNASWYKSSGRGNIQYRVTNTTVLMGPRGNGSSRCAGSIQSTRAQSEVTTWVR